MEEISLGDNLDINNVNTYVSKLKALFDKLQNYDSIPNYTFRELKYAANTNNVIG